MGRQRRRRGAAPPPGRAAPLPYVAAHREGIENYLRHGPQGSGAIEKTIDVAVGRRLKAKGTSWYRPGAHRLLSLRTLKQDRTWNRYRQARRSRTPLLAALAGRCRNRACIRDPEARLTRAPRPCSISDASDLTSGGLTKRGR